MIRFRCTKCGHDYLLADAFARLPLLCRGCGDRMIVPELSESLPEPPPVSPPKPAFERSIASSPEVVEHDTLVTPTVDDSVVNLFVSAELRKKLVVPIEGSGPAMPPPEPMPAVPLPPEPAEVPEDDAKRQRVAKLADAAMVLVMLIVGVFVGETLAHKSTLQVFGDSPASPKFPPTDLLLWVASVAVFGLVSVWLLSRGWSVGAWLKRR